MDSLKFYIDGAWTDPVSPSTLDIINPATEEAFARISMGSYADVDRAARAARVAFAQFSRTSVQERLGYLRRIIEGFRCQSASKRDPLSARKRDPLSGWRNVDVTGFLALRAA